MTRLAKIVIFLKKWAISALFLVFFKQFFRQYNMINVHPVYSAGIRTHDHWDQGSPAQKSFSFYLERKLKIFTAPNVETGVVRSEPLEELLVDREETAGHGRAVNGLGRVTVTLTLASRFETQNVFLQLFLRFVSKWFKNRDNSNVDEFFSPIPKPWPDPIKIF